MTLSEFDLAYHEYYNKILNFCRIPHIPPEDAEDITMNVFTILWLNLETATTTTVQSFLYKTAKRKCIDYIRRKRCMDTYIKSYHESFLDELEHIETRQAASIVLSIVNTLPPRMQKVVKLRYMYDQTREEMAKVLHMSPNTVRNTLVAGVHKVRTEIKNRGISYHG
jgi:RNA polymerase sigma factor (sigma-70 family)